MAFPTSHVVRQGETTTSVARLYRVTCAELLAANPDKPSGLLPQGYRVFVSLTAGEVLRLPPKKRPACCGR